MRWVRRPVRETPSHSLHGPVASSAILLVHGRWVMAGVVASRSSNGAFKSNGVECGARKWAKRQSAAGGAVKKETPLARGWQNKTMSPQDSNRISFITHPREALSKQTSFLAPTPRSCHCPTHCQQLAPPLTSSPPCGRWRRSASNSSPQKRNAYCSVPVGGKTGEGSTWTSDCYYCMGRSALRGARLAKEHGHEEAHVPAEQGVLRRDPPLGMAQRMLPACPQTRGERGKGPAGWGQACGAHQVIRYSQNLSPRAGPVGNLASSSAMEALSRPKREAPPKPDTGMEDGTVQPTKPRANT